MKHTLDNSKLTRVGDMDVVTRVGTLWFFLLGVDVVAAVPTRGIFGE